MRKCTKCNTELTKTDILEFEVQQPFCANCCEINYGYNENETDFVVALQGEWWIEKYRIADILRIARKHL